MNVAGIGERLNGETLETADKRARYSNGPPQSLVNFEEVPSTPPVEDAILDSCGVRHHLHHMLILHHDIVVRRVFLIAGT